jgi:hypothetical protein
MLFRFKTYLYENFSPHIGHSMGDCILKVLPMKTPPKIVMENNICKISIAVIWGIDWTRNSNAKLMLVYLKRL